MCQSFYVTCTHIDVTARSNIPLAECVLRCDRLLVLVLFLIVESIFIGTD